MLVTILEVAIMFDNIGGKIKTLASVICVVGIIASVILAIALWTQNDRYNPTVALGFGVLIGGGVASWVGSFFMYGFGELIEETTRNRVISEQLLKALRGQNEEKAGSRSESASRAASVGSYTIPGTRSVSSSETWRCKMCNSINHRTEQYCANCGEYK